MKMHQAARTSSQNVMLKRERNVSAFPASHFQFSLRFLFLILDHREFQTCYAQRVRNEITPQTGDLQFGSPHRALPVRHSAAVFLRARQYSLPGLLHLSSSSEAAASMSPLASDEHSLFSSSPCTVLDREGVGKNRDGQGENFIFRLFGPKFIRGESALLS